MMIVGRTHALPERGKIKIGGKGETRKSQGGGDYQLPVKYDHFVVTTMDKDGSGNFSPDTALMQSVAALTGQKADHLTTLPVRLLYDDIELDFGSRYACYSGKTLVCSGNGDKAQRLGPDGKYAERACTCERLEFGYAVTKESPLCKINGVLAVVIEGMDTVGAVWKFRTTSFNSWSAMMGSMQFIQAVTGGKLAGIPLLLTLRPKQVTAPNGAQQTVYVVSLEFPGDVAKLQSAGYALALQQETAKLRLDGVANAARLMLEAPGSVIDISDMPGEDDDTLAEFYPKQSVVSGTTVETGKQGSDKDVTGGPVGSGPADVPAQGSAAPTPEQKAAMLVSVPDQAVWDSATREPGSKFSFATPEEISAIEKAVKLPEVRAAICARLGLGGLDELLSGQVVEILANVERIKFERKKKKPISD